MYHSTSMYNYHVHACRYAQFMFVYQNLRPWASPPLPRKSLEKRCGAPCWDPPHTFKTSIQQFYILQQILPSHFFKVLFRSMEQTEKEKKDWVISGISSLKFSVSLLTWLSIILPSSKDGMVISSVLFERDTWTTTGFPNVTFSSVNTSCFCWWYGKH